MPGGLRTPPSNGSYYGSTVASGAGDVVRVIPEAIETGSFIVRAWNNSGPIYIGWDEEVDDISGFPLEDGQSLTMDLDASDQGIYFFAPAVGDSVRVLATN
jgi:hypothetical protein